MACGRGCTKWFGQGYGVCCEIVIAVVCLFVFYFFWGGGGGRGNETESSTNDKVGKV